MNLNGLEHLDYISTTPKHTAKREKPKLGGSWEAVFLQIGDSFTVLEKQPLCSMKKTHKPKDKSQGGVG